MIYTKLSLDSQERIVGTQLHENDEAKNVKTFFFNDINYILITSSYCVQALRRNTYISGCESPQKSAQLPTVSQKETKYTASDFWCAFHFIPPCFACLLARCIHVAAGTKNLKSPSTDDFKFSHQ